MKTKNLLIVIGISSFSLLSGSLSAQVGTSENNMSSSSASVSVEDRNEQRIYDLNEQLKDAQAIVKKEKNDVKKAKENAKEAKAALRAEKQAQKARENANNQARKAERALN